MEANRLLDEEEEMVITREGKQPFSSPPCSSSSSHHYHQYHNHSHHQQPPPTEEKGRRDVALTVEREHMFDKVVTPSDVGKLNRLVIPKQHAERYFPLDSAAQEKSLLLCFEDSSGKPWHFRYSYWNSSQSYVMTKGWSRFVKDKKLDAGDVVSFHRARDKLFIGWRRRLDHPPPPLYHHYQYLSPAPTILPRDSLIYWPNPLSGYPNSGPVIYMRQAAMGPQGGRSSSAVMDPRVYESVPVVQAAAEAAHKRLRLFGVNMDICPITSNSTNVSDAAAPNCNPHAQFLYPFQLTMYNGAPASSSTSSSLVKEGKSSSSSMSLDLEFSEDI